MAEGGEKIIDAEIEHLVVDAGAFIRLENLADKSKEFYTIKEVISEVRDKQARAALERLPFEIKVREPSEEALKTVIEFSKKTGDFTVLSMPDIKLMALTYMIHKQVHGTSDLRKEPAKPGSHQDDDEDDSEDDDNQGEGPIAPETPKESSPHIDIKTSGIQKPGVSWASALRGKSDPSPDALPQSTTAPSTAKVDAASMWDDDDFAGVEGSEQVQRKVEDTSEEAGEEWPSLAQAATMPNTEDFILEREKIEHEIRQVEEKKKLERLKREEKQRRKAEREAERLKKEQEQASELEQTAEKPKAAPSTGSRLLGMSSIRVDTGPADEEDDGVGWITTDNILDVDPFQGVGRGVETTAKPVRLETRQFKVACVTTDYAMQNVMMQMRLRLVSLEGRAISHVRRFVLKCDSCATICRQLEKRFCPSCGNPTLARLSYSISPEGVLRYHYKKGRRVNTRGMKYSMHKPTGGRTGDLLLSEDQLMMGYWAQQSKKKTNVTSMFGEHVTESLGLKLQSQGGEALRIGYGRQNPNAAKGRERRGKKKKRNAKRPGYL